MHGNPMGYHAPEARDMTGAALVVVSGQSRDKLSGVAINPLINGFVTDGWKQIISQKPAGDNFGGPMLLEAGANPFSKLAVDHGRPAMGAQKALTRHALGAKGVVEDQGLVPPQLPRQGTMGTAKGLGDLPK